MTTSLPLSINYQHRAQLRSSTSKTSTNTPSKSRRPLSPSNTFFKKRPGVSCLTHEYTEQERAQSYNTQKADLSNENMTEKLKGKNVVGQTTSSKINSNLLHASTIFNLEAVSNYLFTIIIPFLHILIRINLVAFSQ